VLSAVLQFPCVRPHLSWKVREEHWQPQFTYWDAAWGGWSSVCVERCVVIHQYQYRTRYVKKCGHLLIFYWL